MAKRINISIPDSQVPMLAEFDSCCKDVGLSRSEVLVELMTQYITPPVYNPMSDEVSRGQKLGQAMAEEFGTTVGSSDEAREAQERKTRKQRLALDTLNGMDIPEGLL